MYICTLTHVPNFGKQFSLEVLNWQQKYHQSYPSQCTGTQFKVEPRYEEYHKNMTWSQDDVRSEEKTLKEKTE